MRGTVGPGGAGNGGSGRAERTRNWPKPMRDEAIDSPVPSSPISSRTAWPISPIHLRTTGVVAAPRVPPAAHAALDESTPETGLPRLSSLFYASS